MRYSVTDEFLTLRADGRKHREALETQLRGIAPGTVVEISFARVKGLGGSATDEFLGKLLTARHAGDIPDVAFIATGLNEDTAFEVNMCLAQRGVAVVADREDDLELLGGDDYLKATFLKAAERDEFNATELAEELAVTPQNINNRLKRLVSDGALLRWRNPTASGKQFVYRVPSPSPLCDR